MRLQEPRQVAESLHAHTQKLFFFLNKRGRVVPNKTKEEQKQPLKVTEKHLLVTLCVS